LKWGNQIDWLSEVSVFFSNFSQRRTAMSLWWYNMCYRWILILLFLWKLSSNSSKKINYSKWNFIKFSYCFSVKRLCDRSLFLRRIDQRSMWIFKEITFVKQSESKRNAPVSLIVNHEHHYFPMIIGNKEKRSFRIWYNIIYSIDFQHFL